MWVVIIIIIFVTRKCNLCCNEENQCNYEYDKQSDDEYESIVWVWEYDVITINFVYYESQVTTSILPYFLVAAAVVVADATGANTNEAGVH